MRWCEAITDGMTKQEALDFVRAILPRDLIGDHGYGHWEDHVRYPRRSYLGFDELGRRRVQSVVDGMTFRLRRALALDPSMHGQLNNRNCGTHSESRDRPHEN
jgi:hypothetical protein